MTAKEIIEERENLYNTIKHAEERIKELREICKHEETFEADYSWRVGATIPSTICSICGKVIKMHEPKINSL